MRGLFFFLAASLLLSSRASAETEQREKLDSVIVSASRAGSSTPVTFTMVGKEELKQTNPSNSLPMALTLQPSVVTFNEGGTGLGNSAMTVRGSKGSQINVTLNGITLNDGESQEVFWVNIPSLPSLISSVQLQRGLGTTANGSGAFGASINMSTSSVSKNPFAGFDLSVGSWNTFITSFSAGTGLSKKGLYFNVAYNRGYTDGYVRNAKVRSQSAFISTGWIGENKSLRFTYLLGDQHSGITWDGIDLKQYYKDRRYNSAGIYTDEDGNVRYYENAIDRYNQQHFQLNYTQSFAESLVWTTTLNYTYGFGYDEYYKEDKKLSKYGLDDTRESDIIYRKNLRSDYYVLHSDLKYTTDLLRLTTGIYLSGFDGYHYGNVLWASKLGNDYDYAALNQTKKFSNSWYSNRGLKYDSSVFARAEYDVLPFLTLYADVQYRNVNLNMKGIDDDKEAIPYSKVWNFVNPRAGVTFRKDAHKAFFSVALGHREPGRSDIKDNVKGSINPIRPERMLDFELGYEYTSDKLAASSTLYFMDYKDILIETGNLSSSGYAIKENVPKGYRAGIELAAKYLPFNNFTVEGNLTLSRNRLARYISYVRFSDYSGVKSFDFGSTDMLLSPSVVGMISTVYTPFRNISSSSLKTTTFGLNFKYVGKQYLDNTSRANMLIPAYNTLNFTLSHEFKVKENSLMLTFYANNILNRKFYASGYRWEKYNQKKDEVESNIGVYPQAPANFMFKLTYKF